VRATDSIDPPPPQTTPRMMEGMQTVTLSVAGQAWSFPADPAKLIPVPQRAADAVGTPRELVRAAMESPFGFGPIRTALTPDDRIAVVLDESLPHAAELLAGVLDHLSTAGIAPAAVTVVTAPPGGNQGWIDDLPDEYADVVAEVHDPADRRKFAYLAASEDAEPIYLNRTVVEADAVVVLAGVRFDAGRTRRAADALFPALSGVNPDAKADAETEPPTARDVLWKLGSAILVQVIPGTAGIHAVVAGLPPSAEEAGRLLLERWTVPVPDEPDTVIAVAETADFAGVTRALKLAAKVVAEGGRVVVLSGCSADEIAPHRRAWARAGEKCRIFVGGGPIADAADDLNADAIATASELARVAAAAHRLLVLQDALRERPRLPKA
jgi:hypothetical protein